MYFYFILFLAGIFLFTPGLFIVLRAKPTELKYYAIFLLIPFLLTILMLVIQLAGKEELFDPTDWYLIGLAFGVLSVIINLFLFKKEIEAYYNHHLITTKNLYIENNV